jgi:hypothetical protein
MRITWNDSDKEYNVIFNIQINIQETWDVTSNLVQLLYIYENRI